MTQDAAGLTRKVPTTPPQVLGSASTQASNRIRALYRDARRSVHLLHDANCLQARPDPLPRPTTTAPPPAAQLASPHSSPHVSPALHPLPHPSQVASLADALGVPPALAVGAWYARKIPPPHPQQHPQQHPQHPQQRPLVVVLSDSLAASPGLAALLARLNPALGAARAPEVLTAAEYFPRFYAKATGAAPRVAELFEQLQARCA